MEYVNTVFALLLAYLIGSINFAILISCLKGRDIRKTGSGNPGATNAAREYGVWMGILIFAFDFGKTMLAMWIGGRLAGSPYMTLCGGCCLLGHCFPLYYRFRGGKGISCGAAIALMLGTQVFSCDVAIFLAALLLSRKSAVASLAAAAAFPILVLIFCRDLPSFLFALLCSGLIIYRHKENIKRLKNGTEPDFRAKP